MSSICVAKVQSNHQIAEIFGAAYAQLIAILVSGH